MSQQYDPPPIRRATLNTVPAFAIVLALFGLLSCPFLLYYEVMARWLAKPMQLEAVYHGGPNPLTVCYAFGVIGVILSFLVVPLIVTSMVRKERGQ